jgi:L-ascorbate metabolism protein UlaG (beta-lactamase superfamily)
MVIIILLAFSLLVYLFLQSARFGTVSTGSRRERINASPNFRNGKFQNLSFTPDIKEGVSYFTVIKEFLFDKSARNIPTHVVPSKKTNLYDLDRNANVLIWFGHSSYFMQIDGIKFLVDPVFSGSASPVSFTTRSFKGTDVYTADEIPDIDFLLITHDHWDHLDYQSVSRLKGKVKKVITGLGTGAHLERWGYDPSVIIEEDWNKKITLGDGFELHTTPARHFSGRGLKRNQALWMSYVLQTPSMKIYIGGDSGYDSHFKMIGEKYGPFDLAILECGQYHEYWKYIHMLPHEVPKAAADLNARVLMPVHWAKFSLALHDWDEPIEKVVVHASQIGMATLTPMIGEIVDLKTPLTEGIAWWK